MEQKPTIGRIVHYTNLGDKDGKYPPEMQAAMITGVYEVPGITEGAPFVIEVAQPANNPGKVPNVMLADLRIFYRSGEFYMTKVPFSEAPARGSWNWPPKI